MKVNILKKKCKTVPQSLIFIYWTKLIIKKNTTINIKIVNTTYIKKLNKKYRNLNKETDVLTFKNKNISTLGDIIICKDIINNKKQNNIKNWQKTTIHSLLHLLNYNHLNNIENNIMNNIQNKIGMSGIEPPTIATSK